MLSSPGYELTDDLAGVRGPHGEMEWREYRRADEEGVAFDVFGGGGMSAEAALQWAGDFFDAGMTENFALRCSGGERRVVGRDAGCV